MMRREARSPGREPSADAVVSGGVPYSAVGLHQGVIAEVARQQLHEDRGDPDSPTNASEPIEFTRTNAELAYQQRFNRVTGRIGIGAENENYDDVASITGTTLVPKAASSLRPTSSDGSPAWPPSSSLR